MKNFTEGHRYIVALRGLRDAQNNPVDPPPGFRLYRDRLITQDPAIENRRPHMENLISTLQANGIPRANLYMTWDFTVASEHSLAGRALAIRDNALRQLGDTRPATGRSRMGARRRSTSRTSRPIPPTCPPTRSSRSTAS